MLTVADVMTRDVITIKPDTPVEQIAELLYAHHISGVPVLDDQGRVVGILSEGDLMAHTSAIGEAGKPRSWWLRLFGDTTSQAEDYIKSHGRTAADVMSRSPLTVGPDASLGEVAALLEKHRIKRLPVVDGGKLVGIVSRANLLRGFATAEAPPGGTASDREIKEKLETAIDAEGFGRLINPIVQDGTVHLWGIVDKEAERRAIVLLAQRIPGVKAVEDHLGTQPVWAG